MAELRRFIDPEPDLDGCKGRAPKYAPGQTVFPRSARLAYFRFVVTDVMEDEGEFFYRANQRDWLAEHMLQSVEEEVAK